MINNDRMDNGRDPSAHTSLLHREYSRVTLVLSNLSNISVRKSGVTLRRSFPLSFTLLRTVERQRGSHPGCSPFLEPRASSSGNEHLLQQRGAGRECSMRPWYTQGCTGCIYTQGGVSSHIPRVVYPSIYPGWYPPYIPRVVPSLHTQGGPYPPVYLSGWSIPTSVPLRVY